MLGRVSLQQEWQQQQSEALSSSGPCSMKQFSFWPLHTCPQCMWFPKSTRNKWKRLFCIRCPGIFVFPLSFGYQLSRIKEKYTFKLNTKSSTQARKGQRWLLILFFVDICVAHHCYDTGAAPSFPDFFAKKHKEYLDISSDSINTENQHNSFIYKIWWSFLQIYVRFKF